MEEQLRSTQQQLEVVFKRFEVQDKKNEEMMELIRANQAQMMELIRANQTQPQGGPEMRPQQSPTDDGSAAEQGNHSHSKPLSFSHKVELSKFNGTNTKNWLMKCGNYFEMCKIPINQRIHTAALHMVDEAEVWVNRYLAYKRNVNWYQFMDAVNSRFVDNDFGTVVEQIDKLQQVEDLGVNGNNVHLVFDEVTDPLLGNEIDVEAGGGPNEDVVDCDCVVEAVVGVTEELNPVVTDEANVVWVVEAVALVTVETKVFVRCKVEARSKIGMDRKLICEFDIGIEVALEEKVNIEIAKFDSSHDWGGVVPISSHEWQFINKQKPVIRQDRQQAQISGQERALIGLVAHDNSNSNMTSSANVVPAEDIDGDEQPDYDKYSLVFRLVLLLVVVWMTLLVFNSALVVIPISLGRSLFIAVFFLLITHGIKCNDLYAFVVRSYVIWTVVAGARYSVEYIKSRRATVLLQLIWKRCGIVIKSSALLSIWIFVIPVLIGFFFELLVCFCTKIFHLWVTNFHSSKGDGHYLIDYRLHNVGKEVADESTGTTEKRLSSINVENVGNKEMDESYAKADGRAMEVLMQLELRQKEKLNTSEENRHLPAPFSPFTNRDPKDCFTQSGCQTRQFCPFSDANRVNSFRDTNWFQSPSHYSFGVKWSRANFGSQWNAKWWSKDPTKETFMFNKASVASPVLNTRPAGRPLKIFKLEGKFEVKGEVLLWLLSCCISIAVLLLYCNFSMDHQVLDGPLFRANLM